MRNIYWFSLVVLIFLLCGCSTTYYYTEFLKPSNRYIPSSIYVVGIVQRSTTPNSTCPVYTNGIPYGEIKEVPYRSAVLSMENLKELCQDIGRFEFIDITMNDSVIQEDEFATRKLTASEIQNLTELYELDAIISLDGHAMTIRTSGSVGVVTVNDNAGLPTQVPEFSKESQVSMSLLWRFYNSQSGQMIDEYQESYERFFNRVSLSEEDIQEFKEEDMGLLDVSGMAAYDYFERIAPHWEPEYRQYFNEGSEELALISRRLDLNGDWKIAADSWLKLTSSPDLKIKHKACFNMALASEILGQPKVAKEWITKAKLINPTKRTLKYEELLDKQILIYQVVNSQLGIPN